MACNTVHRCLTGPHFVAPCVHMLVALAAWTSQKCCIIDVHVDEPAPCTWTTFLCSENKNGYGNKSVPKYCLIWCLGKMYRQCINAKRLGYARQDYSRIFRRMWKFSWCWFTLYLGYWCADHQLTVCFIKSSMLSEPAFISLWSAATFPSVCAFASQESVTKMTSLPTSCTLL